MQKIRVLRSSVLLVLIFAGMAHAATLHPGPGVKMFSLPLQINPADVGYVGYIDRDLTDNNVLVTWNGSNKGYDHHAGVDFSVSRGTPVVAAAAGTIVATSDGYVDTRTNWVDGASDGGGFGNYVVIQHVDGIYTLYGHMTKDQIPLKRGASVRAGTVIGYVGSSGISTGPHLHFQVNQNPANVGSVDHYKGGARTGGSLSGGTLIDAYSNSNSQQWWVNQNGYVNGSHVIPGAASFYSLAVTSSPTSTPYPIVRGQTVSVAVSVVNNGDTAFAGDFAMALYTTAGDFVGDLGAVKTSQTVAADGGTKSLVFATSGGIVSSPGWYQLWFKYRPNGGGWGLVPAGGAANPRLTQIIETASYVITAVAGSNGSISPQGPQPVASGGSLAFTATPNNGYVVDYWTLNGSQIQTGGSRCTVSNVTASQSLSVYFKTAPVTSYSVTSSAGSHGSISPSGAQSVSSGGGVLFSAYPDSGYVTDYWMVNGSVQQYGGNSFNLTSVTTSTTLDVYFKLAPVTVYSVSTSAGLNGSISPAGSQTVVSGGSVTFSASPAAAYVVDFWAVNGTQIQTGGTSCTLTGITSNKVVAVYFKAAPVATFAISTSAGPNGSISPAGVSRVLSSGSATFTATPASGYSVEYWYVDGIWVQTGGSTFTLSNVTYNRSVSVTFKPAPAPSYLITATAGAGGSITPSGATQVPQGQSLTLTAAAQSGYVIDAWSVDGAWVQTGGTTVTQANVTAAHTVQVTFRVAPGQTFLINATAGTGGTISPAGARYVASGSGLTFTATPAAGSVVDTWFLDGIWAQTGSGSYSLSGIATGHTVSVTFKPSVTPTTIISPLAQDVSASAGSYQIAVTSNTSWVVDGLASWLSASPSNGSGNGIVTINHAASSITTARNDVFTIGGQAHWITQAAAPTIDDSYEPNNGLTSVYNLSSRPNTWLSQINGRGQQRDDDFFSINTQAVSLQLTVDVLLEHALGDIDVAILNASGSVIGGSYGVSNSEHVDMTLPSAGNYFIRVFGPNNGNGYDLKWQATGSTPVAASRAINPLPISATSGIPGSNLVLSWDSGGSASMFSILFNTSGVFPAASASNGWQVATSTTPQNLGFTLTPGTTYYWRVDTSNDAGHWTTGDLWSFTSAPQAFTVTAVAGVGGSVGPGGAQQVASGGSITFTASADAGFTVDAWYLNGGEMQRGGNTCTLYNVTGNHNIYVGFADSTPLPVTVSASAGTSGSLNPSGALNVISGGSVDFVATPVAGFAVEAWSVDGLVVQLGGNSYRLAGIIANRAVSVTFAATSQLVGNYAYLRSASNVPWNVDPSDDGSNESAMNSAFGSGAWDDLRFESVDAAVLFSSAYKVIFMDGSDYGATPMEAFIQAHMTAMQDWVAAGGHLFLNAAPKDNNGMALGFGAYLNYNPPGSPNSTSAHDVSETVPGHAIFRTPVPAPGPFSGTYGSSFSHGSISAGSGIVLIEGSGTDTGKAVLVELNYGSGLVMLGGMTLPSFQLPQPQVNSVRSNILLYLKQQDRLYWDLEASGSGSYSDAGAHDATNPRYFVGLYRDQYTSDEPVFRGYFVFDLPTLRPGDRLVQAELRIPNPSGGFFSYDASETLRLNEVKTPTAMLQSAQTTGPAIFADLGDGAVYGTRDFTFADNGTQITIPLNSNFLTRAAARSGQPIAIGAELTTINIQGWAQHVFGSNYSASLPHLSFSIEHSAVGPQIEVVAADGAVLTSDGETLSFGKTTVGGAGVPQTLTLRNASYASQDLSGLAVSLSGAGSSAFTVSTAGLPASLSPGQSSSIVVTLSPASTGVFNAVLQIASNDTDQSPFVIPISGSGISSGSVATSFNSSSDVAITSNGYAAAGRVLSVTLNFMPTASTQLTVINNTGLGFIFGTFNNLAQGQLLNLDFGGRSYPFVANYFGGTGNDLVLVWADTTLFAWGDNGNGSIGDGTVSKRLTPTATSMVGVLAGQTILSVVTGASHSFALTASGTVVGWGYNGGLGDGTSTEQHLPVAVDTSGVLAGRQVIRLAAGAYHCLALCSDGTLVSWGSNSAGALGVNSKAYASSPVLVFTQGTALEGKTVVDIAAGHSHSLALCSDGTVAAWGYNDYGQLGDGTNYKRLVPVQVLSTGTALAGKTVAKLAAGHHSLALCTDGTLVAWGGNWGGQLGDNSTTTRLSAVAVATSGTVLAGKTITSIAASPSVSLALCSDGTLAAWGANGYGQIGDNTLTNRLKPTAVARTGTALAGRTVTAITAGAQHVVARCSDGTFAAWGDSSYGQIGDGGVVARLVPTLVNLTALGGMLPLSPASGSDSYHSGFIAAKLPPTSPEIALFDGTGISGFERSDKTGTFNYPATTVGSNRTQAFTIKNTGNAALTGLAVTKATSGNPEDFVAEKLGATTLGANELMTFSVTFSPTTTGTRTALLQIASNDANESPFEIAILGTGVNSPPTDIALSTSSIAENNAANATVGTLSATDVDVGDAHTFTLVAGTGSTDNASFTIVGNALKLTPSANFETKSNYAIRVRATDNGAGNLTFEKAFTVAITNVNEAPIISTIADQAILPSTSTGALSFTISDVDSGTLTISVKTSTNLTLVPIVNIVTAGTGNNRTVTVTPVAGQTGFAAIGLTVSDGSLTATTNFLLRVFNNNANLSALALSAGSLSPAFAASTTAYAVTFSNAVSSLSITPTLVDANATMKVNNVALVSGSASAFIPLSVGTNADINISVTAQDSSTKTYTITPTRNALPTATSLAASSIGSSTATLNGSVNANGASTTARFLYGLTTSYGSTASVAGAPLTGTSANSVSATLSGLQPATLYYFKAQATNATADTAFGADMTFTTKDNNAKLAALALSSGSIAFSPTTLSYNLVLSNATTTLIVTPTLASSTATMQVNGSALGSGSASNGFALSAGSSTPITISTTAEDGSTLTYTLNVLRNPLPNAMTAEASNITSTSATLNGEVNANGVPTALTFEYGTSLPYDHSIAAVPASLSTGNTTSASLALTGLAPATLYHYRLVATNATDTAQGLDMTFTTPNNESRLAGIALDVGTLAPSFASDTKNYRVEVSYATAQAVLTATTLAGDATMTVQGNATASANAVPIALSVGDTLVPIQVTAQNGTSITTYQLTLHRRSDDADLASLTTPGITFDTAFSPTVLSYNANVPYITSTVTVGATAHHALAQITAGIGARALSVGSNTLPITVQAEDGNTQTYTLNITRAVPSSNAALASLVVGSGTLAPAFNTAIANYTLTVPSSVSALAVTLTAQQAQAMLRINSIAASTGTALMVPLSIGDNPLPILITAEDGIATQSYTLQVHRQSNDRTLADVNLGSVAFSFHFTPTDAPNYHYYYASVPYGTTSVMLSATTSHASASIIGTLGLLSLQPGENNFVLRVYSEDTSINPDTYYINVMRSTSPVIVQQPISAFAYVGDNTTLSTAVIGNPTITYQWQRNGSAVKNALATNYTMSPITMAHAGRYVLRAKNSSAEVLSDEALLGIIARGIAHKEIVQNSTLTLTAAAAAPSGVALSYKWLKNGFPISGTTNITGLATNTLRITHMSEADEGGYTCRIIMPTAKGDVVGDTGETIISLVMPPDFSDVELPNATVSASYSATPPLDPDTRRRATHYTITGLPPGLKYDVKTGLISGVATAAKRDKLGAVMAYSVTVTASNASGQTTAKLSLYVNPLEDFAIGSYAAALDREINLNTNLGGCIAVKVASTGLFTGKVTLGVSTYAFSGALDNQQPYLPTGTATIKRKGGLPDLRISFDIYSADDGFFGTVETDSSSVFFTGWRQGSVANASAYSGYYTWSLWHNTSTLDPTQIPQGSGIGSISIATTGAATLNGHTADGESFTAGGYIGANGNLLLYTPLYTIAQKGSLLGHWQIISGTSKPSNALDGELSWLRPKNIASDNVRTYAEGFSSSRLAVAGGYYSPPAKTEIVMQLDSKPDNTLLGFNSFGLFANPQPDLTLTVQAGGGVIYPTTNPRKLKLSITPTTGAFSGSFIMVDDNPRAFPALPRSITRTITYHGMIIGSNNYGVGYLLVPQLPSDGPPITSLSTSQILSHSVSLQPK